MLSFKKVIKTAMLVVLSLNFFAQQSLSFKSAQLKNKRVQNAYANTWIALSNEMKVQKIDPNNFEIFIRAFKHEAELELWLRNKNEKKFILFKTIPICASSGELGPKRQEGDGQVPEGLYEVSAFNPASSYHLSLKVSYPNKSDKVLAKGKTGGDIMIHGNCVTIGCIPLQNDPIEEVYILCVEAQNRKLPIKIEIYPCRFTPQNKNMLKNNFSVEKNKFWENIKPGYTYFETNKTPAKYKIDEKGNYVFEK